MYNTALLISFKAGFFYAVIQLAGLSNLFEVKLRVSLVACNQAYCADTENAVEQASAKSQIDHSEHIQVINTPVEDTPAPLNPLDGNLIISALQFDSLY